jgi:NADPH2:quinone reductase
MRAVVVEQFGPVEQATVRELADPQPGPGEVLIETRAIGVNFPDILVMEGRYQVKPPLPFIPGKELAGVVVGLGAAVDGFKVGDRVAAQVEYGAYAQKACAAAANCFRIPEDMEFDVAAAMGLAYQTAYFALLDRAGFRAGDTVLATGAAGGVGLAALQLARALGATVVAAVGSADKAEFVRQQGAHYVVRTDDATPLRDQVRELIGRGADIVIDPVGGAVFEAALRSLDWCGRLVVVGFAAGEIPSVRANYLLVKNISVHGLQWSDYRDRAPERVEAAQQHMYRLYQDGELKPYVARRFALEEFAAALETIRGRRAQGKLVLIP